MPIQRIYRTTSEALANYNYTDLADGLGIIDFYLLVNSTESNNFSYYLSPTAEYSALTETSNGASTTYSFDTSAFNLPRIARGTAFLSVGVVTSFAATITFNVTLQKVASDGVTTTDLTATVANVPNGSSSGAVSTMMYVPLPITTDTQIAAGEKLRLKITSAAPGGNFIYMGVDPVGRAATHVGATSATTTRSRLKMPFAIET